ncbi:MAG: hypothetical protein ACI9H9_001091 [Pseudoalteromonas tetraodonis]|jgi:hypothetical protein
MKNMHFFVNSAKQQYFKVLANSVPFIVVIMKVLSLLINVLLHILNLKIH